MKRLKKQIEENLKKLEANPLFAYLRSTNMSAKEKLTRISPIFSFFIFGFKDLMEFLLPYPEEECKSDIFKAAINEHCREDSTHWKLLLKDLETLGLNHQLSVTTFFSSIWGESNKNIRKGFYELLTISEKADSVQLRYCMIEAFEAYATALFKELTNVGSEYERETGHQLLYYGKTHLDLEEGHMMQSNGDEVSEKFWGIELNEKDYQRALEIVNLIYENVDVRRKEVYLGAIANPEARW